MGSVLVCTLALAQPAVSQIEGTARPSVFAIDTSASIDEAVDGAGNFSTGVLLDAVVSADLSHGFQGIVRPFAQRLANGEWNRQVWVAALRYERPGRVGLRVDAGLIPSPVGLGNLTLRPHLIPTIAQPASLFTPLPSLDVRGPRTTLLGAVYPYGAHVTVSATHWDVRAALIDTSPIRTRRIFARTNPPRFAQVVIGAGVTPFVGFRVGTSVTRGGWLRAAESPTVPPSPGGFAGQAKDRDATIVTIESELSFRYTKLSGEWVRDAVDTSTGERVASGWFLQGQQTLAPRWFVGGRVERIVSPAVLPGLPIAERRFTGTEETLGYRLTPEITLRLGHRARRGFGRPDFDHQAAVSVVWWRRWV